MDNFRWINQSQPQTLYGATILCYIDAVFGLIGSSGFPFSIALAAGLGAGGIGIANDKRWGYMVAIGASILQVLVLVFFFKFQIFGFPLILNFMFDALLVALLLHPASRDHNRIWFR